MEDKKFNLEIVIYYICIYICKQNLRRLYSIFSLPSKMLIQDKRSFTFLLNIVCCFYVVLKLLSILINKQCQIANTSRFYNPLFKIDIFITRMILILLSPTMIDIEDNNVIFLSFIFVKNNTSYLIQI